MVAAHNTRGDSGRGAIEVARGYAGEECGTSTHKQREAQAAAAACRAAAAIWCADSDGTAWPGRLTVCPAPRMRSQRS